MLKDGIYEQIVNTRISNEINEIGSENYEISLELLNADDARRVLTIYVSHVINQGLRYLRDSHGSTKDEQAIKAQIMLCNDIIEEIASHTDEKAFEDNVILEKGEVLM